LARNNPKYWQYGCSTNQNLSLINTSMSSQLDQLLSLIKAQANPERAVQTARFFKTGKGQYAEGDLFWGLSNPALWATVKPFITLDIVDIQVLMVSAVHEHRAAALHILVKQFQKGSFVQRRYITEFYLANLQYVNNWDLVDASAREILGGYIFDKDRSILYDLAESNHLWSQRVAIVATHFFIQRKQYSDTFLLCKTYLDHPHDLMHKACGWMLREVGKRDLEALREFLDEHLHAMPRTMLRYAIEKMQTNERRAYLLA
jgi:3-methyladenine DNA glycosylase AlkD